MVVNFVAINGVDTHATAATFQDGALNGPTVAWVAPDPPSPTWTATSAPTGTWTATSAPTGTWTVIQ